MSDSNKIIGYENQSFPQGLWIIYDSGADKKHILNNIEYNYTFKGVKEFCKTNNINDISGIQLYKVPEFVKRCLNDFNFNYKNGEVSNRNDSLWINFENDKSTSISGYLSSQNYDLNSIYDVNEHIKKKLNNNDINNIYEKVSESGDDFICIKVYGDDNKTVTNDTGTIFFNSFGDNSGFTLVKINITSRQFKPNRLFVYTNDKSDMYSLIYLEDDKQPERTVYGDDPYTQNTSSDSGTEWHFVDKENFKKLLDTNEAGDIKVYKQYTEYRLSKNL